MSRTGFAVSAVTVTVAMFLATAPVSSQPPFSATYDSGRQVKFQGPVTRIDWVNPHAFFFVDVRDATGTVTNWAVELASPLDLERDGWKRSTLNIGDVATVEGLPTRAGTRQAFAKSVVVGGKRLFTPPARRAAAAKQPTPKWPDGQVRLGPPVGRKGYWGTASAKALVETSAANIPMTDDGLLINLADADKVAPFKPWAKALYELRQRTLLQGDPMARCIPPGGPRQFLMSNGFQLIEQRELGRILVLLGGGDRNWRMIFTDGRPPTPPAELVPTYYGSSVGKWQGDTLVVDSAGYNEKFWMTSGGLPHTEALHLTERFSRPDLNTLKYEVTVDDPQTYTRPWTGGWTIQWVPDQELQEYFCEENAESTFIR